MASIDPEKKKALGRGLGALIPNMNRTESGASSPITEKKNFFECEIEKIVPNTYQPRKIFEKGALEELSESIKAHGVIQPLVVRHQDGRFELIAGERRWRAAQKAGLKKVPVIIKDVVGDGASLEMAIIENIQRQDLNCIEEAIAYQQLVDEFQLSQEEVAKRVGKSRVTVANTLRLLKLPALIREDISVGRMTMGHARALLSLESASDQLALRDEMLKKKFSVREMERRVNEILKRGAASEGDVQNAPESERPMDANLKALEDDLRRRFSVPVKIAGNETKGTIQISYTSREVLMEVADKLKGDHVSTTI